MPRHSELVSDSDVVVAVPDVGDVGFVGGALAEAALPPARIDVGEVTLLLQPAIRSTAPASMKTFLIGILRYPTGMAWHGQTRPSASSRAGAPPQATESGRLWRQRQCLGSH